MNKSNQESFVLSEQDKKRLVQFFQLPVEADMRLHPENYQSSNGNIERADAVHSHQVTQDDQTGK